MVGTICMWVTRWRAISCSMSSGSKRGSSTILQPLTERQHAVGVRRRMVHRPVHQDDLIVVRLDAVGDGADPRRCRELFGPHRLAAHALGLAGGAGGIEHRRGADRRLLRRRVAVAPEVPVRHAVGDFRQRRRDVERRGDFRRALPPPAAADDRAGRRESAAAGRRGRPGYRRRCRPGCSRPLRPSDAS